MAGLSRRRGRPFDRNCTCQLPGPQHLHTNAAFHASRSLWAHGQIEVTASAHTADGMTSSIPSRPFGIGLHNRRECPPLPVAAGKEEGGTRKKK